MIGLKNADIASSSNCPAITLPFKSNEINLPVGIEISALTGEDEKLIAIAKALETVLNSWFHKFFFISRLNTYLWGFGVLGFWGFGFRV